MLQYKDLYDMVLEITLDSGVPIEYDAEVTEIDEDSTAVRLGNGQEIQADLIVGADGCWSKVRPLVS